MRHSEQITTDMNQQEISKMRQEMGEIAIKLVQQDQQLNSIAQSVTQLQEFSEASQQPAEPANFREQINQSANSEHERDSIARLYGFANFSEIPVDLSTQL